MMWIIYSIFAALDTAIYNLVGTVYTLLMDIASISFSSDIISAFTDRVYVFLGLFMLFKISFSLIKYIINPDEFSDKSKGGKKLLINIVVVLFLIIATPTIFDYSRKLQTAILEEQVIPKFVMGIGGSGNTVDTATAGNQMATITLSAFYYPKCADAGVFFENFDADDIDKTVISDKCVGSQASDTTKEASKKYSALYTNAYNGGSIWDLFFDDTVEDELVQLKGDDGEYVMNYTWLISTAVGIVLLLLLVVFCFDIAVRVIKLGFLELMAPIPIVSYIDPDSSKNGMFSKWLKECIKTYLDLFIRLLGIYFAVFVISLLMSGEGFEGLDGSGIFVKVFIVFGTLLFAKQLPQLISDITGIKFGAFTLNPMNKLREVPLAGKAASVLGGGVVGTAMGLKYGKDAGSPLKGAAIGGVMGAKGMSSKVPLTGAKPGSQAPGLLSTTSNAVAKSIFGKDYTVPSVLDYMPKSKANERVDRIKNKRDVLNQAKYKNQLQMQINTEKMANINQNDQYQNLKKSGYNYDQLVNKAGPLTQSEQEFMNFEKEIRDLEKINSDMNVTNIKYDKDIATYSDQIKDIEKFNRLDESTAQKMADVDSRFNTTVAGNTELGELYNKKEQKTNDEYKK